MQHYRHTLTRLALVGATLGLADLAEAQHKTWYLAEGAANDFFQEEILIANPNPTAATVSVALLKSDGAEVTVPISVPATSRYTLRVNTVAGMENATPSAVVTSDLDIIVERTMTWPGTSRRGGHNEVAVAAPALKWYLAEGSLGFFETYILIGNPSTDAAQVTVTYLRSDGTTLQQQVAVPARSRRTIWVNQEQPDAGAFSTIVESTNGVNIIAERAMYWNNYEGGHDAVGVTAPSLTWRFAEGFTGSGFQTFLLLANPNNTPAQVRVTALFDDGTAPLTQEVTLGATTRSTIEANLIPQLQNRAFSLLVESLNGVATIAERSIYYSGFQEGSATAGLTGESLKFAFAEGQEDRFTGLTYESFFLLANATDSAATVTATFYREDGTGIQRQLTVNPRSRFTLSGKSYPELSNQRFAAFFESNVALSAERAMYWGPDRFGGHGSTGTAWTGVITAPPAPPAVSIASISPNTGSGGSVATIIGANFTRDTQVRFGNTGANIIAVEANAVVCQVPGGPNGTVGVTVTSNGQSATLNNAFVYPNAPPPPPPPNRTPDPPAGQLLPVPDMSGLVAQVAAQNPGALRNSCQDTGGSWEFLDKVVDRLRQEDTRWGYNCKRGNCPDLSQDVLAYHAGAGPEVNGALQTRTIDIISGHCGGNPVPWWSVHAYGTGPDAARWHNRGRF